MRCVYYIDISGQIIYFLFNLDILFSLPICPGNGDERRTFNATSANSAHPSQHFSKKRLPYLHLPRETKERRATFLPPLKKLWPKRPNSQRMRPRLANEIRRQSLIRSPREVPRTSVRGWKCFCHREWCHLNWQQ